MYKNACAQQVYLSCDQTNETIKPFFKFKMALLEAYNILVNGGAAQVVAMSKKEYDACDPQTIIAHLKETRFNHETMENND